MMPNWASMRSWVRNEKDKLSYRWDVTRMKGHIVLPKPEVEMDGKHSKNSYPLRTLRTLYNWGHREITAVKMLRPQIPEHCFQNIATNYDLLYMGIFEDVSKFMLYPIWILKGHMITNEDKLPLHRQKYSHFHLACWSLCFFLLSVVTAWAMFHHVKQNQLCAIIWKNIKATFPPGMACCLLWGWGWGEL